MDEQAASAADTSVDDLQGEVDRLAAENERLSSRLRWRARARTFLTGALVVITALMLVASTVAVWGKRTVFDTDRFMNVIDPALEEQAFYDSLSRNISDQVLEALDLETRVRARLTQLDLFLAEELVDALDLPAPARRALGLVDRPTLADLTPSIVDPLEQRVTNSIDGFITSDEFQQRLPLLVRRAHQATMDLLNDDLSEYPNVYIADGDVRLNLIPIIVEALRPALETLRGYIPDISLPDLVADRVGNQVTEGRAELAAALGAQLPEDFGQLTVMSEDALRSLQDTAQRINRAVWLLVILTVALLAITVAVSPRRRRTVIALSIGIAVALAVAWWIVARVREAVLDEIVQPDSRAAVGALLRETGDSFRTYVVTVLVIAVLAGIAAFVVAHTERIAEGARWARLQTTEPTPANAWVTEHYDGLRVGAFVAAGVLLLLVGISFVPFVVIGALLGLALWALAAMRRTPSSTTA